MNATLPNPVDLIPPSARATPREPVTVFDPRVVTGSGGGPDKTILNSPRYLTELGYRMICGYLHPPGDPGFAEIERKAAKYGAPLIAVPDRGPWDWRVVRELLAICKRENVRIWHGHDYKTNAIGWLLKRFWPMKLVTTVHGWVHHTARTPLYYRIDKLCLPRYDCVICVSPDLVQVCREVGVKEPFLLENAIDTEEYTRTKSIIDAKRELGIPVGELVIGAVGRLEKEKAFDLLIQSLAALRSQSHAVRLVILGEGSDRERLQTLARDLGVAEYVQMPGWQSDVRSYFEAMDLFALSSLREGLPNVLLEAMALEVPVVATAIAGIPQLITDRTNGRLVPAGDAAALTRALHELLSAPEDRRTMARAARRTIETRYSFPVRMRRLARLYDDLLADSNSQRA